MFFLWGLVVGLGCSWCVFTSNSNLDPTPKSKLSSSFIHSIHTWVNLIYLHPDFVIASARSDWSAPIFTSRFGLRDAVNIILSTSTTRPL